VDRRAGDAVSTTALATIMNIATTLTSTPTQVAANATALFNNTDRLTIKSA